MRALVFSLAALIGAGTLSAPASAQISIGFSVPGVSIGVNVPAYPQLVQIPGYPVYYAPDLSSNFFFYEGQYWAFMGDNWYTSNWYNGPWMLVSPMAVPYFILRIPVAYYRLPPAYFRGWAGDRPPHWGEHWGRDWDRGHRDWDHWDRRNVPRPAPLPDYQRQYGGRNYPMPERQQDLHQQNYPTRSSDPQWQRTYEPNARGTPAVVQPAQAAPYVQAGRGYGNPQPGRGDERRQPNNPGAERSPAQAQPAAQPQMRERGNERRDERGGDHRGERER